MSATSNTASYDQLLQAYSEGQPPENIEKERETYLKTVQQKSGEHNKRAYLKSKILEGWLNIPSEVIGFEENRNDMWVNGIIVETKAELSSQTRADAKEKCIRYRENRRKNEQVVEQCIITDGIQFEIYTYHNTGSSVELRQSNGFNILHKSPNDSFKAIYDAFFPKNVKLPLEENVVFTRFYTKFQPYISQIENEVDTQSVEYQAWKTYLASVFGESADDSDLVPQFARQTYLYVLSIVVSARAIGIDDDEFESLTRHDTFLQEGVYGMVDDSSFFSWLPAEMGNSLLEAIDRELLNFDMSNQQGDFFRLLYESAISPEDRHALGEFYTPPWLADVLVDIVSEDRELEQETVLDPGCGSGTFLKNIVDRKLSAGQSVNEVTSNVIGFDINPIAVCIAKANYLLTIREALQGENTIVKIPVFLADTLMPDVIHSEQKNKLTHSDDESIKGVTVRFSDVKDYTQDQVFWYHSEASLSTIDDQIAHLMEIAIGESSLTEKIDVVENDRILLEENEDLLEEWTALNEKGDNHIWSYILHNIYTPNYYRGQIDIVIGNPPWLTYKDIGLQERQDLLDDLHEEYDMGGGWHVKTQQDLGAFFMTRCQEFFSSRNDAYIAFVYTRTLFNGSQYDVLRRGSWDGPTLSTVIDIDDDVNPFRVSSCMVVLEGTTNGELEGYRLRGEGQ